MKAFKASAIEKVTRKVKFDKKYLNSGYRAEILLKAFKALHIEQVTRKVKFDKKQLDKGCRA